MWRDSKLDLSRAHPYVSVTFGSWLGASDFRHLRYSERPDLRICGFGPKRVCNRLQRSDHCECPCLALICIANFSVKACSANDLDFNVNVRCPITLALKTQILALTPTQVFTRAGYPHLRVGPIRPERARFRLPD